MQPQSYFNGIVKPLVAKLKQESRSLPLIYACTTTLYHIVDYTAKTHRKREKAIRQEITRQFPDFQIIYSLAIAQKHSIVENASACRASRQKI